MFPLYHSPEEFLSKHDYSFTSNPELTQQVSEIIARVRQEGDAALKFFTQKFDEITLETLRVSMEAVEAARNDPPLKIKQLFLAAIENVRSYHQKQRPESWLDKAEDGAQLGMQFNPINRVGAYIPGGKAAYPSTVIMTIVPAQIAGVERLVLVSPPTRDGLVNSYVLAVASLLDIKEIFAIGGAQAIAALAYGTESIPKVDKIVGPGNAYVNEAKRQVFGAVGIDQLAGPTELVVLADEFANPEYIVRDLFAQAEHDTEARAILVTTSKGLTDKVKSQADQLIKNVERANILQNSLKNFGAIVWVSDLKEGVELINKIAPEHAQIFTKNPENILPEIKNAGAICLGEFTPAVVGDYFAGPNHVLPTAGNARFSSPLNVMDFIKFSSVINYSKERFDAHAAHVSEFAELEGLINHKNAIQSRYE